MRKKDLLHALGNIDDKYIAEAQAYTAKAKHSPEEEDITMEVATMNKPNIWKTAAHTAAIAAAFALIVGTVAYIGNGDDHKEGTSSDSHIYDAQTTVSTIHTTQSTQQTTQTVPDNPMEVGDGIYRISSVPTMEKVTYPCVSGTIWRDKGTTVQAYEQTLDFQTLDFSAVPNEYDFNYFPYCVCSDASTVYFADYMNLYRSDVSLKQTEFICSLREEESDMPIHVRTLISFPDSDLLYFNGDGFVGTINPETGEVDYVVSSDFLESTLCNNGVLAYGHSREKDDPVIYWENGTIYEIPLNNPRETEFDELYISANGTYICTFLRDKAEDDRLIERYSVYDTKSGEFIRSFDWTFNQKVGNRLPMGFTFLHIDEKTESVYVTDLDKGEYYQFYFGE